MQNDNSYLYESIQCLKEFFEIFFDAFEIAALPIPTHRKPVAIRSRNQIALMLQDAVDRVIQAQDEEGD